MVYSKAARRLTCPLVALIPDRAARAPAAFSAAIPESPSPSFSSAPPDPVYPQHAPRLAFPGLSFPRQFPPVACSTPADKQDLPRPQVGYILAVLPLSVFSRTCPRHMRIFQTALPFRSHLDKVTVSHPRSCFVLDVWSAQCTPL